MEMQQIFGFYYVVKRGSFSKAAEITFRSQPALSMQIKHLEEELGIDLLKRMGKFGVQPTLAGEKVFEYASSVIEGRKNLLTEIEQIKMNISGQIKVGAPLAIHQYYLIEIASKFKIQFPDLGLRMFHLNPRQCIDKVISGELDLGIVHDATVPNHLEKIRWQRGEYSLITPKGHELSCKENISIHDITSYPLILPEENVSFSARQLLDKACLEAGITYYTAMETPNIILNADYVKSGFGISCVLSYKGFRDEYSDQIDFINLNHLFPPQEISIIMRKSIDASDGKRIFLEFMEQHKDEFS